MRPIVIGTRGSALAMRQTHIVQTALEERFPDRRFTVRTIKVQADKQPETPLAALGGEGIFVRELETALMDGTIDLAIHSLKDLTLETPASLRITAVLERDDPRDALVSRAGGGVDRLPNGARVGTSSLRRRSQLLRRRPDLQPEEIRGNVDTRLRKLDEGRYDAIVLAACGLIRLGLEERITEYLDVAWMLPEPGQGALAIETRADDDDMCRLASTVEHPSTRACVEAERSFLLALGGGCRVPIAAYATLNAGTLALDGSVVAADGSAELRDSMTGPMTEPVALGERLASRLASQGAGDLLAEKS